MSVSELRPDRGPRPFQRVPTGTALFRLDVEDSGEEVLKPAGMPHGSIGKGMIDFSRPSASDTARATLSEDIECRDISKTTRSALPIPSAIEVRHCSPPSMSSRSSQTL
jgi:hypothetical protein